MKKNIRLMLAATLVAAAGAVSTAAGAVGVPQQYSLDFATASGVEFTNSFLITPTISDKLIVSVYGGDLQFSALSFDIAGGPSVASRTLGHNLIASFNDGANSAAGRQFSLSAGQSYLLTVTGTTKTLAAGNTGSITVSGAYGAIDYVPEVVATSTPSPVPEPETYALLLAGLGLVGAAARRRRSSAL